MSDKIYISDEIVVPQAQLAQVRDAYHREYVPAARARGMTLEGAWRSPPIDLPDRTTTLHFLWSVPDAGAWWQMRLDGVEQKARWWAEVDAMIASRKRTVMVKAGEDGADV